MFFHNLEAHARALREAVAHRCADRLRDGKEASRRAPTSSRCMIPHLQDRISAQSVVNALSPVFLLKSQPFLTVCCCFLPPETIAVCVYPLQPVSFRHRRLRSQRLANQLQALSKGLLGRGFETRQRWVLLGSMQTMPVNLDSVYSFAGWTKVLASFDSASSCPSCVSINEPIDNIIYFTYCGLHICLCVLLWQALCSDLVLNLNFGIWFIPRVQTMAPYRLIPFESCQQQPSSLVLPVFQGLLSFCPSL
jgi:hypothetical protein